jgi:uncharacterized protein (TIGR02466 family)
MTAAATAPPADPWAERFTQLWPTRLFERRLARSSRHNRAIARIVLAMDSDAENMTTDYKGADLLNRPERSIAWLRAEINDTLRGYLDHCGITYPIRCDIQAWANVNRRGDYHVPHNHGWSYLSGTYYVAVPARGSRANEAGMTPGAITFSDPRQGAARHSIAPDPDAQARHTIHPRPGTLLMWPSSLTHYVHPNHRDEARISISFNVVLEWSNDYAG